MRLLVSLLALSHGLRVEEGGTWGDGICTQATKWTHTDKTGKQNPLAETTAETEGDYKLSKNVITINADNKKRNMMGTISCWKAETVLGEMEVTGDAKFRSIPNALTNLNEDQNKRIECEAEGFPLPQVSWRFQPIEEEFYPQICGGNNSTCNLTKECLGDICDAEKECENKENKETCQAAYDISKSSSLFTVREQTPSFKQNLRIRYADPTGPGCGMKTETNQTECQQADSETDVGKLPFKTSKSQLFFTEIQYVQGGKYICVATQKIGEKEVQTTKAFVWRVKDPLAALWPFLALVAEVVIVVCIILYYERASQKKSNLAEADEGDEFIAAEAKKEES